MLINEEEYENLPDKYQEYFKPLKNDVVTLKNINLMRYLCRLITPPQGTVLDPFAGSGTTGIASVIEGFDYILIERRERFAKKIAPKRIEYWSKEENHKELKDHHELPDHDGWMGTEQIPVDSLSEVRGIGEETMESVKEYNKTMSLNELKKIDGIGDKTIERIKDEVSDSMNDILDEFSTDDSEDESSSSDELQKSAMKISDF